MASYSKLRCFIFLKSFTLIQSYVGSKSLSEDVKYKTDILERNINLYVDGTFPKSFIFSTLYFIYIMYPSDKKKYIYIYKWEVKL